jgi:hypothetical protein
MFLTNSAPNPVVEPVISQVRGAIVIVSRNGLGVAALI